METTNTKEVIFADRRFVNLPGSNDTGSIQAQISIEEWTMHNGEPVKELEYRLDFTDCSRTVNFNIHGDTPRGQKNAIHKVNSMIEVLQGFKDGLEIAFKAEDYIRQEGERKTKEKEDGEKES